MDSRNQPTEHAHHLRTVGEGTRFFSHTLGRYIQPADCYELSRNELGILWAECKATSERQDNQVKIARIICAKTFLQLCSLILSSKIPS